MFYKYLSCLVLCFLSNIYLGNKNNNKYYFKKINLSKSIKKQKINGKYANFPMGKFSVGIKWVNRSKEQLHIPTEQTKWVEEGDIRYWINNSGITFYEELIRDEQTKKIKSIKGYLKFPSVSPSTASSKSNYLVNLYQDNVLFNIVVIADIGENSIVINDNFNESYSLSNNYLGKSRNDQFFWIKSKLNNFKSQEKTPNISIKYNVKNWNNHWFCLNDSKGFVLIKSNQQCRFFSVSNNSARVNCGIINTYSSVIGSAPVVYDIVIDSKDLISLKKYEHISNIFRLSTQNNFAFYFNYYASIIIEGFLRNVGKILGLLLSVFLLTVLFKCIVIGMNYGLECSPLKSIIDKSTSKLVQYRQIIMYGLLLLIVYNISRYSNIFWGESLLWIRDISLPEFSYVKKILFFRISPLGFIFSLVSVGSAYVTEMINKYTAVTYKNNLQPPVDINLRTKLIISFVMSIILSSLLFSRQMAIVNIFIIFHLIIDLFYNIYTNKNAFSKFASLTR